MQYDELTIAILDKGYFGAPIYNRHVGLTPDEFRIKVQELGSEGLVIYEISDQKPFEGEAVKVKVTDKGKEVIDKHKGLK